MSIYRETTGSRGMRETFMSDTYVRFYNKLLFPKYKANIFIQQNKLYERELAKPKNIRDFTGTFQNNDATYHHLHTKKDGMIGYKRATDHRDIFDTSHRQVKLI